MALELRQQLKLTQQLVMTPQLQQAIKLLQLSRLELEEVVNQELEENPVLEEVVDVDDPPEAESAAVDEKLPVDDNVVADGEEVAVVDGEATALEQIDDWQTYLQGFTQGGSLVDNSSDNEPPSYENLLARSDNLWEHLLWQLRLSDLSERQQHIGAAVIGNLDDNGYLVAELEEIAGQCSCEVADVEAVLAVVQRFDPVGVAARNLPECLMLQLENLGMAETLAMRVIRDFARELEQQRYQVIARKCGVSVDDVLQAARELATLDPYPASGYNTTDVQYITPDIFVFKRDGDYVVTLNDDGLANLRISSYYRNILSSKTVDSATSEYIQEKMRGAEWLIKSIHQRQRTIYRVTCSIVKFQRDFFDYGIDYLKPLVLREVAEDIEMHESTISRVTTNKYVQTPQGLFELKFFFNSGIGTSGGAIASESVKSRIKEIIAAENPKKPYSDQKIVELLRRDGIDIARRTVTKYREMLGIGSSTARKRLF